MISYKYSIGQKIKIHVSGKNWDDEWDLDGEVIGICNYFVNASPQYIVGVPVTRIAKDGTKSSYLEHHTVGQDALDKLNRK